LPPRTSMEGGARPPPMVRAAGDHCSIAQDLASRPAATVRSISGAGRRQPHGAESIISLMNPR